LGVCAVVSILYHPDFIKVGFVMPFLLIPGASMLVAPAMPCRSPTRRPSGRFAGNEVNAQMIAAVRAAVERDPLGARWMYSYPDDAWLYLASGARNPTASPYCSPGTTRRSRSRR